MPTKEEIQRGIIAAGEKGDEAAVKFLGDQLLKMQQAEPKAPSPGIGPSAVRGAVLAPYSMLDMAANTVAAPVQFMLAKFNLPTMPKAGSSGYFASRMGIGPPQTRGERFAEMAGGIAGPGGLAAKAAQKAGKLVPVLATEAASLVGAHTGREIGREISGPGSIGEAAGTLAGSLSPAGFGMLSRQLAAPKLPMAQPAQQIDTLETFNRQGVSPSLGDVTDQSYLQNVAKHMPGGHGVFRDLRETQAEQMRAAVGRMTRDVDEVDAGVVIQKGIKNYVGGRFKKVSNQLAKRLDQSIPPDTPIGMANTRNLLDEIEASKGAFKDSLGVPALKTMRRELDEAEAAGLTFESVRKAKTAIGHRLMSFDLVSDIPRADLKRLYGALNEDIKAAAVAAGPKAEANLKRLNRYWGKGIERVDNFLEPLSKKVAAEDSYKALFKSVKDSPTRIKNLSKSLKPAEREVVLDAMLRKMGEPTPGIRSPEYTFSPETFLTNLNKIDQKNFDMLARGTKYQDLKSLEDLKLIAGRLREVDKVLKNPSQTAETLVPLLTAGGLGGSAAFGLDVTASALAGVGTMVGGSYGVSKLLTNPKFIDWTVKGSKLTAAQFASHAAKLALVVKDEDYATQQSADKLIKFFEAE